MWHHLSIAYVSKNYILLSIYCFFTCKIVTLPSCETFYLWVCLKFITTLLENFAKRRKIIPVKECHLLLSMRSRRLFTSQIYINSSIFWYRVCLVPKMSNKFAGSISFRSYRFIQTLIVLCWPFSKKSSVIKISDEQEICNRKRDLKSV